MRLKKSYTKLEIETTKMAKYKDELIKEQEEKERENESISDKKERYFKETATRLFLRIRELSEVDNELIAIHNREDELLNKKDRLTDEIRSLKQELDIDKSELKKLSPDSITLKQVDKMFEEQRSIDPDWDYDNDKQDLL